MPSFAGDKPKQETQIHPEMKDFIERLTDLLSTLKVNAKGKMSEKFRAKTISEISLVNLQENPDYTPDQSESGGILNTQANIVSGLVNLKKNFEENMGFQSARLLERYHLFQTAVTNKTASQIEDDLNNLLMASHEIAMTK